MAFPKEFDIQGKGVIVTGASRGIGKGIVTVLAQAGARVLVTALTNRYLEPLSQEMAAAGHPVLTLTADATRADHWDRTVHHAIEEWGNIDALINNVGDAIQRSVAELPGAKGPPMSDEDWQKVIDINLTQAFMGCRAVGPHMMAQRRGKVINVSGVASRKGAAGLAAYAAAKAGLTRLTQALAIEWAPYGITVNSIAPGSFPDPELGDPEELARRRDWARSDIPLGRVGDPREIGLLSLYLVSSASDYMTGETVYIDGGASYA